MFLTLEPAGRRIQRQRGAAVAREARRGRLVALASVIGEGQVPRRLRGQLWVVVPAGYHGDPAVQTRITALMARWWAEDLSTRVDQEAGLLAAERRSRNPRVGVVVPRRPKPTPRVAHGRGPAEVGAADDWTTRRRLPEYTGGEIAQHLEWRSE